MKNIIINIRQISSIHRFGDSQVSILVALLTLEPPKNDRNDQFAIFVRKL